MRGALIGCGFFAQNHLHAWADMHDDAVDLVAVCDRDRSKAEAAAAKFGIPKIYTDAAALLGAESIDFIDIATQMGSHEALAMLAIGRGVRTIVQKPFAPDWEACVRIVDAAQRAKVPLAVHENFRFQSPMRVVASELRTGTIGAPTWARLAFRTGYDVYRTQPYFHDEPRLAILDVGIHVLDLARVFLGEVVHLSCETQRRNAKNRGEDTATIMMRHTSNAVSLVECTYEARQIPDPFPQTLLTIEGERGSLKVHDDFRMVVTADGRATERSIRSAPLAWTEEPWHTAQESVLNTQRAIIGAWREGREAETSGVDNLKTFALVEAAYLAASERRAIEPAVWRG